MLTKNIMSATIGLALTTSVAMLAGCPTPGGNVTPTDSASPSASATTSASPSASATTTASPTATATTTASPTATGTATPSPSQSATNNTTPSGQTGQTPDVASRATFNGKVFDPNNVPVSGAKVNAKSIDANVSWVGEEQITTNGAYVFRNAPVGARIQITVTKDGWTTREQTEVLKSNLQGDPLANVFDFAGINAIQDEPEITLLKINGRAFTNEGPSDHLEPTVAQLEDETPNLSGVDNSALEVEMQFSESVDREDVENNFKITSQNFTVKNGQNFVIDENLSGVSFTWGADDKSVIFKTNKAVLADQTGTEARYLISFTDAFTDKTDKEARPYDLAANRGGYIRFSPGIANDFAVFSVKNDTEDPKLTGIAASDGGAANDIIRLTFSEPLEVINQGSVALSLANPADVSDLSEQLFAVETNNGGADPDNATLIGYNVNNGSNALADFRAVYAIGKIVSPIPTAAGSDIDLVALDGINAATAFVPTKGNGVLKNARIDRNVVTLEFSPEAFKRDDRVIVSVGRTIDTQYFDRNNNVGPEDLDVDVPGVSFSNRIQDPAGRNMATGNSTTSANIDVNDSQRVSTAS